MAEGVYAFDGKVKPSAGVRMTGWVWLGLLLAEAVAIFLVWIATTAIFGAGNVELIMVAPATFAAVAFGGNRGFAFGTSGICLGLRDQRQPTVTLAWEQVSGIEVTHAHHGANVDIVLRWPPQDGSRPRAVKRPAVAEILLTCLPGTYLFHRPALLTPLDGPLRYSVPLWRTSADDLLAVLRRWAPASVTIEAGPSRSRRRTPAGSSG